MKKNIAYFGLFGIITALSFFGCEGKTKATYGGGEAGTAQAASNCPSTNSTEAIATLNGQPVALANILGDANVPTKLKNDLFDNYQNVLDEYFFETLVGKEAEAKKSTKDEILKNEIEKKIKTVGDKEVKAFYAEISGKPGVPPLDKIQDKIKEKLSRDKEGERRDVYFSELKKKYKVTYLLTRPKTVVAIGENAVMGSEKAPVTIVEFSDYQCPFCKRGEETMNQVKTAYKGKVKVYFRDFPLGFHKDAKPAANAARCGGEQGKYWEYHGKLFEKQELSEDNYLKYATELKLDVEKFKSCQQSMKFSASIDKDMEEGAKLGVTGTPAFFINGVFLSGARPFSDFKKIIDDELNKAKSGSGNSP